MKPSQTSDLTGQSCRKEKVMSGKGHVKRGTRGQGAGAVARRVPLRPPFPKLSASLEQGDPHRP